MHRHQCTRLRTLAATAVVLASFSAPAGAAKDPFLVAAKAEVVRQMSTKGKYGSASFWTVNRELRIPKGTEEARTAQFFEPLTGGDAPVAYQVLAQGKPIVAVVISPMNGERDYFFTALCDARSHGVVAYGFGTYTGTALGTFKMTWATDLKVKPWAWKGWPRVAP